MTDKNPKDLTRGIARASKFLRDAGVEVKHTQMLSAIAAYHGFSNREEFLAGVKKDAVKPTAVPATGEKLLYSQVSRAKAMEFVLGGTDTARVHKSQGSTWDESTKVAPTGLVPQLELVELMTQVMDRLANGEDFNQVCEDTSISAILSKQHLKLQGRTLVGGVKAESFIERLLKMSPAELTHADFQIVLAGMRRAFKELKEARGYEPGWMRPYFGIAESLSTDAEKAAIDREFPYKVVSYGSHQEWRQGYGETLVLVGDLAEGIREMKQRLDDNIGIFGCALVSRDGTHRYHTQVRGTDGGYRETPDGLCASMGAEWDDVVEPARALFKETASLHGHSLHLATEALEERICRGHGHQPAVVALEFLGLTPSSLATCNELYAHLKQCVAHVIYESVRDQLG